MKPLPYTIIKDPQQYKAYCDRHEALALSGDTSGTALDEMELLELLIEKWNSEHSTLRAKKPLNPVELIQHLMAEHQMQAKDLATMLGVSKGLVSDILNYKKGMSKEVIRKLARHFKLRQEVLNQAYSLQVKIR